MSRPHDEGHRANDAPQVQTQNQHLHFANDGAARKALVARAARCDCMLHEVSNTHNGAFLGGDWNYIKAAPCLRSVGDMLRQIGSRH